MTSGSNPWPTVSTQQLRWNEAVSEYVSRRTKLASQQPFMASIPARIAALTPLVPSEIVAELDDLSTQITRLDAEFGSLIPLVAALLRSESASSSEVERLSASAKQLGLAAIGRSASENARLIVDNVAAMQAALELDSQTPALSVHKALLARSAPEIAGRLRERLVWVGGDIPQRAEFVGPPADLVADLMEDLRVFDSRADIPKLVQLAISHAQFLTIHPFEDGNGRTARALLQRGMRATGLTTTTIFPISAGLLSDTRRYFDSLGEYRNGNLIPLLEVFINAGFHTLTLTRELKQNLERITSDWRSKDLGRQGSTAKAMIDLLVQSPAIETRTVTAALGVSAVSALKAITLLQERGILTPLNDNRRDRIWLALEVIDALESFAKGARRRG